MDDPILSQILLQLILIMLNAVFAAAEIAVISFNDNKLAQLAAKGDKRAVRLARLTSQPARFLATIQVAITLSGFLGSAFAADNFSDYLVASLKKLNLGISVTTLDTISVILITIILSYFTLVLGELVPKRIAMKNAEKMALDMSSLITFISKLFAPIVSLLTASTNGILRLFGIDPNAKEDNISEEEIRMLVDAGSEKGIIDEDEKEFIQNVFEFDDLSANEISTHRTEISLLWMDESPEQWEKTIHESRHTHYPVCDETVDNIIGVLNAKDYFRLTDKSRENVLREAIRPAYFVPETVKADVLFRNMKQKRDFFAIVLDEYGGMSGIVTLADLLECIVGEIDYDGEDEEPCAEIEAIDSKTWKILGGAPLKDVEKVLQAGLECEDCETFGGYVLSLLGSIPEDGTELSVENDKLSILITEVKEHRIERTIVCLNDPEPEESKNEKTKNEA